MLDGAINGPAFLAYIEQFLVPTLRPGDVVVLDNLSSNKVRGVREAIEAASETLLYLPSYSPDLNPDRVGVLEAQTPLARRQRAVRR